MVNTSVNGNPGSEKSGLVDLLILSRSAEIFVTVGSSYGYVASAMTNLKPWYVTYGQHYTPHNPPFWQQINSEPCTFSCYRMASSPDFKVRAIWKEDGLFRQFCACHPIPGKWNLNYTRNIQEANLFV